MPGDRAGDTALLERRTAAYLSAYGLYEAVQGEQATAANAAVTAALEEAEHQRWPEVSFVLNAARAVFAVTRNRPEAAPAAESLVQLAEDLQRPALLATALSLRAVVAGVAGDVSRLLADASRAVALLDDDEEPALDRSTGYVAAAAVFHRLQLWELVDELYAEAAQLQPYCAAPAQAAAISVNRVLTRVEWGLALLENGVDDAARVRLHQALDAVPAALAEALPPLWRRDVEACQDIVGMLTEPWTRAQVEAALAHHETWLAEHGDVEVLPQLRAAAALALLRGGDTRAAARATVTLATTRSASSSARSFPAWVRAAVLAAARPSDATEAARDYATLVSGLRWESREAVLVAARARIGVERRRHEHEQLARAAHTDALTGLHNRRSFDAWLQAGPANGTAGSALLLLDLDGFKQVNDAFGHGVGDDVLRRVGHIIGSAIRPGDQAFRQGGDEFAILLRGDQLTADVAQQRAHHLRRLILDEQWADVAPGLQVTATVGLAYTVPGQEPAKSPVELYRVADAALYVAKDRRTSDSVTTS